MNEPMRSHDPVCGMQVRLDVAREDGLTTEHDGVEYAFCRESCLRAFLAEPATYLVADAARHDARHAAAQPAEATAHAQHPHAGGQTATVVIDEGMRRWYDSCSCCLGDAFPEVKATLDEERRAAGAAGPGAGICEVAEGTAQPSAG